MHTLQGRKWPRARWSPSGNVFHSKHHWLKRSSTIGQGGDTTISSPGRSPKQHLPGMRLHDPLHSRQACSKFIAFDQVVGQYVSSRGRFRTVPSQNGDKTFIPPPLPIVERVWSGCESTRTAAYLEMCTKPLRPPGITT